MTDYISRVDALSQNLAMPYIYNVEESDAFFTAYYQYWNILANLPAADVVERKTGKWERNYDTIMYWWECSECHHDAWYDKDELTNYCPWCGAKMVTDDV